MSDRERLITFMLNLNEAGIERAYVVKRGYDFALALCRTRCELVVPVGDTLSSLELTHAMENAARLIHDAAKGFV